MYLINFRVVVVVVALLVVALVALVVVVVLAAVSVVFVANCRSGFARVFVADFVGVRVGIGFAGRLAKKVRF